ncbi:MAG: IPT/TIG domain-containing protein [Acidobacteriota bacterium]
MRWRFSTCVVIPLLLCQPGTRQATAGDNEWTTTGPYGGLFASFTCHPRVSTLMFASGAGSLYRSSDGGSKWERMSVAGEGGWPGAIPVRIHPRDDRTVLAGGFMLFSSSDFGKTWVGIPRPVFEPADSIYDMEFDPADREILYIVTNSNGVFKTTNGGETWEKKNSGLDIPTSWLGGTAQIEVHPADGKTAYVLLTSGKAYKTTNGGDSWQDRSTGLDDLQGVRVLAMDMKNANTLYAGGETGLFRTTDGGGGWAKHADLGLNGLVIDPKNSQVIYACTPVDAWKSMDGGAAWKMLDVGARLLAGVAVHPRKTNTVFLGSNGRGVFRSKNAGKTWQETSTGLDNQRVSAIASHADRMGVIMALAAPLVYESSNSGTAWSLAPVSKLSDPLVPVHGLDIHPKDPDLVAVAADGPVGISADGGRTWAFSSPPGSTHSQCVAWDPQDEDTIYAAPWKGGSALGLARSEDLGKTWKMLTSGLSSKMVGTIEINPSDTTQLMLGTLDGKLFASTNGGSNWKRSDSGLKGVHVVQGIRYDSQDSRNVCAATDVGVYRSTNGGHTWVRKNSQGTLFVSQHPTSPRVWFCGGFGTPFVSADDGETWSAFDSTGLGPCTVNDLIADASNSNRFFIGTSRGVFSYTRKGSAKGPVIEQLAPPMGKVGDAVTVGGAGFGQLQGSSKVAFGSTDAGNATSWTDSAVKVKVPNGAKTGPVTVTVLNKRSNPFEFIVLPSSGNVEPTSGPTSGGTRVTILAPAGTSGTQFNVLFGSAVAANIRFTPPNVITCDSPPGTGTVDVKVTSSVTSTTVGSFTYQ